MKLPVVSGKQVVKTLEKDGFFYVSRKGSHIKVRKVNQKIGKTITVIIPDHKTLKRGTLKAILKQANLDLAYFLKLHGR